MITEQRQFPGYEHMDEFRVPKNSEWYQAASGSLCLFCIGDCYPEEHGGKRWILRKVEEKPEINSRAISQIEYIRCQLDSLERTLREP